MSQYFYLSDQQWSIIKLHLPKYKGGRPRIDDRLIISGILHVLKSGCRWQDCPSEYGSSTTIYNRYHRWSKKSIWQYMFHAITKGRNTIERMITQEGHKWKIERFQAHCNQI